MTDKIPKELKELVLWKLETTIPTNMKLSVGDKGSFTKDELKDHVKKEDDVGVMFANMQLNFMKALASGEFSQALAQ